jgi:hypothetical protein
VHPGPFHPLLDRVAAGAFDHARGNRIARRQILVIAQPMPVAVEVAVNLRQARPTGRRQIKVDPMVKTKVAGI